MQSTPESSSLQAQSSALILIVIVRYRIPLEESDTVRTLATCFACDETLRSRVATLIWDNSETPQSTESLAFPAEYHHSRENAGVAGAYNYAMERAEERGIPWLLLLDQDTHLPADFLAAMVAYAARLGPDRQIAAVAPSVFMGQEMVSPKVMSRLGRATDPPAGATGSIATELIIMNSGMLLRVAALRHIGGYSMDFWLDFSDRYVCHMLHQHGYRAWLAGDIRIDHDVSFIAGTTSPARYAIMMGAIDAYFTQFKSPLRNAIHVYRLLREALRERTRNPERSRVLWGILRLRLTTSRKRRLAAWRRSAAAQRGESGNGPSS